MDAPLPPHRLAFQHAQSSSATDNTQLGHSSLTGTGVLASQQRLGSSRRVLRQQANIQGFKGILAGPMGTPAGVFVHSQNASRIQQDALAASAAAAAASSQRTASVLSPQENNLLQKPSTEVASPSSRRGSSNPDGGIPTGGVTTPTAEINRGSFAGGGGGATATESNPPLQFMGNKKSDVGTTGASDDFNTTGGIGGASISFKRAGSDGRNQDGLNATTSSYRPPALNQLEKSKAKSFNTKQSWEPQSADRPAELPSLLSQVAVPVSTFSGAVPASVPPTSSMYQPYDVSKGTLEQEHQLRELKGELPMSALLAGKGGKKKAAAAAAAGGGGGDGGDGSTAFLTGTNIESTGRPGSGGLDAQRKSIPSRGGSAGASPGKRRGSKKAAKIALPNPFEVLPQVNKKPLPSNLLALHRSLYPKVLNRPDYNPAKAAVSTTTTTTTTSRIGTTSSIASRMPFAMSIAGVDQNDVNELKIRLQDVLDHLASLMPPEHAEAAATEYLRPWLKSVALAAGIGTEGDAVEGGIGGITAPGSPLHNPSSTLSGTRNFASSPTKWGNTLGGTVGSDAGLGESDAGRGRNAGTPLYDTARGGGVSARSNTAASSARRHSRTSNPASDRGQTPQTAGGGSAINTVYHLQQQRIAFFKETTIPYISLLEAFVGLVEPPLPIEEQPKGFGAAMEEDDEEDPEAAYQRELLKNYNEDNCGANVSARICFDLVDHPKRGYVIRNTVISRRDDRSDASCNTDENATDYNFTVAQGLMRGFELIGALEEERYLAIAKKKKKGKKKKLTGADVLPTIRQFHMSCDEFAHLIATDGCVVQSFLPYIIKTAMNGVRETYLAAGTSTRFFGKSQVSANAIRKTEKRTNEAAAAVLSNAAEAAIRRASVGLSLRRKSNTSGGGSRRDSASSTVMV